MPALSRLKHGFESRWGRHFESLRNNRFSSRIRAFRPLNLRVSVFSHSLTLSHLRGIILSGSCPRAFAVFALAAPAGRPSAWDTWHVSQETLATAALLVAFASLVTIIAGTIWNMRDGWRRPGYRYSLAFGWSLLLAVAVIGLLFTIATF